MKSMHLCLSDLIDQDLSAYEYYQTLPHKTQQLLETREIRTLDELQDEVARIETSPLYNNPSN